MNLVAEKWYFLSTYVVVSTHTSDTSHTSITIKNRYQPVSS